MFLLALVRGVKDLGMELVDDKPALPPVKDQPGLPQHAQMVRHVDYLPAEQFGDLADIPGPFAQALHDLKPFGVGHGAQEPGTAIGFESIFHVNSKRCNVRTSRLLASATTIP